MKGRKLGPKQIYSHRPQGHLNISPSIGHMCKVVGVASPVAWSASFVWSPRQLLELLVPHILYSTTLSRTHDSLYTSSFHPTRRKPTRKGATQQIPPAPHRMCRPTARQSIVCSLIFLAVLCWLGRPPNRTSAPVLNRSSVVATGQPIAVTLAGLLALQ